MIKLEADKIVHLKWFGAAAVMLLALLLIGEHFGHDVALALAGPPAGYGLDRYQSVRRAGTVSVGDMIASAAPFWVLAAAWAIFTRLL